MWTRSIVGESRYRRAMVLGRLRYGVYQSNRKLGIQGNRNEIHPDRSLHVYSMSILGCIIASRRRRTKLERTGIERTRRRSGKRIETYTTESVKLRRRRRTRVWRVSTGWSKEPRIIAYEYPILVRLGTVGLIRMVNANDRIGRYRGIEWLSLTLYVIAGFRRGSAYSTEAGLKYFVVGSFGSAWILLGIALEYGWRGSVNRREIERRRRRIQSHNENGIEQRLYRVGWECIRRALLLKLAGAPLHRWLADVYEGAPRPSVMYFTVVPKLVLFYVRSRRVSIWYVQSDRVDTEELTTLTRTTRKEYNTNGVRKRRIGVSARSIRVGGIGALTQRRRKRFRAYSSIGHTGYILLGVRVGTVEGIQGVLGYTRIYVVMTRVMWQIRSYVKVMKTNYGTGEMDVEIRDVKYRTDRYQLGKTNPRFGLRIARTCISMAGVPPMAGFGAKRVVFRSVRSSSYYRLGVRGVLASVVGGYNYIRIVKRMFFDENVLKKNSEEVIVVLNKESARRRGREGRFRTRLRVHPTWFLLRTHRMALDLVSR